MWLLRSIRGDSLRECWLAGCLRNVFLMGSQWSTSSSRLSVMSRLSCSVYPNVRCQRNDAGKSQAGTGRIQCRRFQANIACLQLTIVHFCLARFACSVPATGRPWQVRQGEMVLKDHIGGLRSGTHSPKVDSPRSLGRAPHPECSNVHLMWH